jgi:hypothetical protein
MRRVELIFALIALFLISTGSKSLANLNDGLVAYFPFDKDASDVSGNGNNGILNGNITFVPAKVANGVKLNGVHSAGGTQNPDYIRVKNSASLQFSKDMSISYWMKIDGEQVQTLANCSGDIISGSHGSVLSKSGDRFGWYTLETAGGSVFGINPYESGKGISIESIPSGFNNFRHVCYTISNNKICAYINGRLNSSGIGNVDFSSSNTRDLYIGVQNNTGRSCLSYWCQLDGVIDELRIYNRCLSELEVSDIYNQGLTSNEKIDQRSLSQVNVGNKISNSLEEKINIEKKLIGTVDINDIIKVDVLSTKKMPQKNTSSKLLFSSVKGTVNDIVKTVAIKLRPDSPIPIKYGKYNIRLNITMNLKYKPDMEGSPIPLKKEAAVDFVLSPANKYAAQKKVVFENVMIYGEYHNVGLSIIAGFARMFKKDISNNDLDLPFTLVETTTDYSLIIN